MTVSLDITIEKLKNYCVYRERNHQEVRHKLLQEKVYGDELEQVMALLIEEDFLNEERYAKAYATGKFRQNHWGKIKIKIEMKRFKISEYCMRKGLAEIDDEAYFETMERLWNKKYDSLRDPKEYTKKQKTLKFLMGKGFEYELIKEFM